MRPTCRIRAGSAIAKLRRTGQRTAPPSNGCRSRRDRQIASTAPGRECPWPWRRGVQITPAAILAPDQSAELRAAAEQNSPPSPQPRKPRLGATRDRRQKQPHRRGCATGRGSLRTAARRIMIASLERALTSEASAIARSTEGSKHAQPVQRWDGREPRSFAPVEPPHTADRPEGWGGGIRSNSPTGIDKSLLEIAEPKRHRNKEHLRFVARQPCLICARTPSDPHHLRFAQARALGRKVSDEFVVPLCRTTTAPCTGSATSGAGGWPLGSIPSTSPAGSGERPA